MRTIVILNGPPGCGKDTLANELVRQLHWDKASFKDCLYQETAEHYGIDVDLLRALNENRATKEKPCFPDVTPLTVREMLIHVSEDIIKPRFGKQYFGDALAARVAELDGPIIVADGGFEEEIAPLERDFDQVIIIRLIRDGFTFEGDSRNYVEGDTAEIIDLHLEDGEIASAVNDIVDAVAYVTGTEEAA